jgi:hypothetical protein
MSSTDSPQIKLMTEWNGAFEKFKVDLLEKPLHKDFTSVTHPQSLGMPEQAREQWLVQMGEMFKMWTEMQVSGFSYPVVDLRR